MEGGEGGQEERSDDVVGTKVLMNSKWCTGSTRLLRDLRESEISVAHTCVTGSGWLPGNR